MPSIGKDRLYLNATETGERAKEGRTELRSIGLVEKAGIGTNWRAK
jgi:hypothetical protein